MKAPGDEYTPGVLCIHKYRFKTKRNRVYFVNIPQFERNIYALKFYRRDHKLSDERYKIIVNDYDARNVIFTVLTIGLSIIKNDPVASFVFVGMPKLEEDIMNTKRFRVYSLFASFFISTEDFIHASDINNSLYILLNKMNPQTQTEDLEDIGKFFMQHYNFDFPIDYQENDLTNG
jgi:hypothetical protein